MRGRAVIGVLLVVLGGLLILDQLEVIDGGDVFGVLWPLILVGFGFWGVWTTSWRNFGSLVLLVLGLLFLGLELGVLPSNIWNYLWPVALVVVGLGLLVRGRDDIPTGGDPSNRTGCVAIMGGRTERVTSREWEGGQLTAVMGAVELTLAEAVPIESGAIIDATAIMGGIEIYAPPDWDIDVRATPIMGAVEDGRTTSSTTWPGPRPRLHLRATALMGGIEIKDAVRPPSG